MLPAFVIGLREGLETIVVLGAIVVFLRQRGRQDLLPRIWRATLVATGLCIATALVLRVVEINLGWRQQEQLESVVGALAVVMVTYMVVWMRRFPKDLANDSTSAASRALGLDFGHALVALAFFAVLREGFEIVVFVLATIGLTGDNSSLAAGGAVLGVAVAIVIGVGIVRGSRHVDVTRFFRLTAFILVLSAAGIAVTTVHSANAAGWITFGQTPQYDLSWLAPPGSLLSSITTGMFGLEPYPVLIEVIIWFAYFVPMTLVVAWPSRARSAASTEKSPTGALTATPDRPHRLPRWTAVGLGLVLALGGGIIALVATNGARPPTHNGSRSGTTRLLYATLDGVTCPTIASCVAVGEYLPTDKDAATGDPDGDGRATHTLVEIHSNNVWHQQPSPDAGKGGSVLSSISCVSARECIAVGSYKRALDGLQATSAPPSYPLIEAYDGRAWRVVPSPGIAPNSALTSVSCPSLSTCIAVGATAVADGSGTARETLFVERLNGPRWQVMSVPAPRAMSTGLTSIACTRAGTCVAVGEEAPQRDPSTTRPLIMRLDANVWRTVPLPAGSDGRGILYDVDCPTSDRCVAVGNSLALRASGAGLILESNGTSWSTDTSVLAQQGDATLTTVGCMDATTCIVSGTTLRALDGAPAKVVAQVGQGRWVALDPAGDGGSVGALACSTSRCVGVGSRQVNVFGNTTAFVASLANSTWRPGRVDLP